ncbi:hypothetical protein N9937_01765 [bacterium]|nr:hypothetical protein [bacterium]
MKVFDLKNQRVAGLIASEKLDGVFAHWDGKQLISRNGKVFDAPESLATGLDEPCDGELWAGRGRFQHVLSAIRGDWDGVEFVPHEDIEQTPVVSAKHLSHLFDSLTSEGAEGLILADPDTGEVFKLKKETTMEAKVIDWNRKADAFKSLKCKLDNGITFNLAFNGEGPIPGFGKVVTFSCFEFTESGKPRCPKFVTERNYE